MNQGWQWRAEWKPTAYYFRRSPEAKWIWNTVGWLTSHTGSPTQTWRILHIQPQHNLLSFLLFFFFFFFLLNLSRFLTSQKNGSGIIVVIKSVPRRQGSTREQGTQPHQERRGITLSSSPLLFLIYFPSLKFQFKVYWSWEKRMKKGELDEGMYLLSWCVEA